MTTPVKRILFLTDDQHRFDAYGATGLWGDLRTPTYDRLRAEGTTATQAIASCPICVPNRFSWCHGLLASQGAAGLMRNAADWPMLPSVPGAFQEHGFKTALVGKLHSFHGDYGSAEHEANTRARGFDDVFEVGGRSLTYRHDCRWTRHLKAKGLLEAYRKDLEDRRAHLCWEEPYRPSLIPYEDQMDVFIRRDAVRWIEEADAEQPFFLHVSFCGPHFPLDPPEGWFGRHDPSTMPPPPGIEDPQAIAYWQEQRAAYADLIHLVDHEMGLVLDALEQRGWLDDTLIIASTDHGDRMGEFNKWHKSMPEDGSVRTPWFVRLPGVIPAGVETAAMISAVDIAATCFAAAGIERPLDELLPASPSTNWWPHLCGESEAEKKIAYSETFNWRMVCDSEWKYIYMPADGSERFHNRSKDPLDQHNLIDDPALTAQRDTLRMAMIQHLSKIHAPDTQAFHRDRAGGDAARKAFRSQWQHLPQVPSRPRPER